MRQIRIACPFLLAGVCATSQAQFANNTAIWSTAPFTQAAGSVTDNLQVVPIGGGLVVTGTWQITVPAGPQTGILLEFEAARLMQTPSYTPTFNMSIGIPGSDYITRPLFGNATASGSGTGVIDGIPNSLCGWNFPNTGTGNYFYNNGSGFVSISPLVSYSGGTNRYMRIKYTVDFVYNGPGGTYFFNFPLTGQLVPEPETMVALLAGLSGAVIRRRRRRGLT